MAKAKNDSENLIIAKHSTDAASRHRRVQTTHEYIVRIGWSGMGYGKSSYDTQ